MDEMRIKLSTKLLRGLVSKLISKAVYKNIGVRPDINVRDIDLDMREGKTYFHIDVDGSIGNEVILKLNNLIDSEE